MATVTQAEYQKAKNAVSNAYTADSISKYTDAYNKYMSQGMSSNDAYNKAKGLLVSNTPSTTNTTTSTPKTSSNYKTTTYSGQSSGNTSGTANMNSMSQQKAIDNSRNFQVGTGDVAEMPQQPKAQPVQQTSSNIGKAWGGLTYEQQQERLNRTAGLKDALAKKGIVSKTQPTTTTQPKTTTQQRVTQPQTPKQDQWDYQDNSQARMDQIANNLNGYRQTMPQLFDDMSAFYNFFIKDKGRSQDQIDFLWDYFNRVQKYGKYDNMSPDALGTGIANGTIPEDYLNTLKTTDPQKYQEVISYKKDTEDRIMNESYLNDVVSMAGIEGWESEPSSIQYGKWNGIWLDENGDLIDDRRYHAPTEEELQLSQEDSEYEAEKLRLKNAYKDLQSDLTEQYPDADLSTIMILTSDRGTKIQKALDTISVAQTKTQGRLSYLQNERATMDKAGADSISQLQKNLGMYYQYSPEGIAELAQAQYGATNITLDQADSGNETQKQMALQNVLDGYYDKYGDIIQRSEQQVINDVIAYAKKNGVGLAQALQENFVKYLQQKPEYQQMQAMLSEPNLQTIGYNSDGKAVYGYWDSATKTFQPVNVGAGGITPITAGDGTSYTTNTQPLNDFITNLEAKYTIASNGGTGGSKIRSGGCGTVVNDYLGSVGDNIKLTEANDIKPYATSKTPVEGAIAYFDGTQSRATPETKKHGHVGIVVSDNGDTITVLESNEGTGLRYKDYKKSGVTGYYVPDGIKSTEYNQKEYSNAFTKAGDIVSTGIEGQGNKQMFKETLQGLLDEGDYTGAFEYITITGKNNAKGDAKDKIQAAETAMVDLISIRDALDAYYAAGGDTGILQGSLEKVANKLGKTTDPKLVGLATKISEAIQSYRKNISGTAFSEKEAKEYEALFPTIEAGQEYNNAKLTSTLDSMVIRLNQLYGGLIGPRTYINVLDAHEKATGNRYSMYEQQSQLYNYLSNNGYLNPDGTVKTAQDFASYMQSRRKGKRF